MLRHWLSYQLCLLLPSMRFVVLTIPLDFVPFAGMCIVAWFKALGTARYLHEPVGIHAFLLTQACTN